MIVTANIIPSKHPMWALRMLANLPVERDKELPDSKLDEVKSKLLTYLQDFDYYDKLRRYFWVDHELTVMDRVFTIQTMSGTPLLYIMISDEKPQAGVCAVCGCDQDHACVHVDVGPCWWIDRKKILCSHCALDFNKQINEGIW